MAVRERGLRNEYWIASPFLAHGLKVYAGSNLSISQRLLRLLASYWLQRLLTTCGTALILFSILFTMFQAVSPHGGLFIERNSKYGPMEIALRIGQIGFFELEVTVSPVARPPAVLWLPISSSRMNSDSLIPFIGLDRVSQGNYLRVRASTNFVTLILLGYGMIWLPQRLRLWVKQRSRPGGFAILQNKGGA